MRQILALLMASFMMMSISHGGGGEQEGDGGTTPSPTPAESFVSGDLLYAMQVVLANQHVRETDADSMRVLKTCLRSKCALHAAARFVLGIREADNGRCKRAQVQFALGEAARIESFRGYPLPYLCTDNLLRMTEAPCNCRITHAHETEEKFLVYRGWAGFSNRRIELENVAVLSRALNRTLVVAEFLDHPHPPGTAGAVFDLFELAKYVPVTTEDAVRTRKVSSQRGKLCGPTAHLLLHDFAYSGQFRGFGLWWNGLSATRHKQQPQPLSTLVEMLAHVQAEFLAVDFSYRVVDLGLEREYEYFDGKKDWMPDNISVVFHPTPELQHLLKHLHTRPDIVRQAHAQLPLDWRDGKFVAVHLRRNDMWLWRGRKHAWPVTSDVISQVRTLMESSGLQRVFLGTDASEEEISLLRAGLPGVLILPPLSEKDATPMNQLRRAVMDQEICALGEVFLGNIWSTFSWAIIELRYQKNKATETSSFFHAPRIPMDDEPTS